MRQNKLLTSLRAGRATTGLWMNAGSPLLAELAAHAGLDWILLDTQHGYWGYNDILAATQVISATETTPVARVRRNDPALIGQLLDTGIMGVVVPMVNSPEEAQAAVDAMRYPPRGHRSVGGSRLGLYGEDYFDTANDKVLCAVMIETQQAAEQAEAILAIEGIDLGFIGPMDLALSMGVFGQEGAEHEAMIQHVLEAGQAQDVPMGIYCLTVEQAIERAEQGFQFMPCMTDLTFFQTSLGDMATRWKSR
jgi:2-keto-3-deoxy-L-rhamnonate aldolase RhmA